MVNAFIEFVKDYRKKNPSLSYKDAMKEAAKVYKSDATATSKKKVKITEPNMKMEITENKLPKAERQKKVKKYKKLAKEVESDLGKSRITPKQFNEYVILANVLAGKSQKNSYARHLKMVRRKLNTKKLKPLKEKLDKAKNDSNELIDLLDKQKASNIKRPLKDKSTYIQEQNKMNRYRKILGDKISAFNKDPKNKDKVLPRTRLEKEAEEEAVEVVLTEQIVGNLQQIATGKNLKYGEAYREYKKKNPKGTRTTFKPIYADMKKINKASPSSATPSRASSVKSVSVSRASSIKKIDTDDEEEDTPKKKAKENKPKLTATQLKNLKERKEEAKDAPSSEALFIAMGRPDNAKLLRYVRQLETIQRKDPEADSDLDEILEKVQNLYDNVSVVRSATKPPKRTASGKVPKPPSTPKTPKEKTIGGKKPKSKEILSDTDEEDLEIAKPPPKVLKVAKKFKDRYGREKAVSSDLVAYLKKELKKIKGDFISAENKLDLDYLRQYAHKKFEDRGRTSEDIDAVNAYIDAFETKKYGGEERTKYVGNTPSEVEASQSGSDSFTISEKAYSMTKRVFDLLDELEKRYGSDSSDLTETESQMENPELGLYTGTTEQKILALDRFLQSLDVSGKKNEIEKTLNFGGKGEEDLVNFNIQKVIYAAQILLQSYASDIDKGSTTGEGFAGVEPINTESDLEDAKGGALTNLIHRKLIKNNPNVSQQNEVDANDKVYVKLNKEVYEKPDNRKANLEGFTYVPSQSDKDNAVYQSQKDKKIVIVFRGSAKIKDLKADLGVATGNLQKTSRHDSSEELVKKMKTLFPDYKIILTGHSLGGSLAVSMASKHDLPAVVFNAGHTLGKDNKDSDITFYTKEGDPVSMLGANSYKNVKMIKGSHGNALKDHSLSNFEGGSFLGTLGDLGKAVVFNDRDASNKLQGEINQGIEDAKKAVGGALLGSNPATYSPNPIVGGSLVGGIKNKLMDYAKENSKVKKALLLRDIYSLVKRIKNQGFKRDMVKEIGKIALDLNDLA